MRVLPLILSWTALFLSPPAAVAEDDYPVTTASLAEAVVVGMHLSAKHAVASGNISEARAQCVLAIEPSAFHAIVGAQLKRLLTAEQLRATEAFFTTPVGKKYAKYGILQIYRGVGEPLPMPLPEFSDSEYKEVEVFAATDAGQLFIGRQVMQSEAARQAYGGRIRQLLEECPK